MIDLELVVDAQARGAVPGAVAYETGATREELAAERFVYEHHGQGFSERDPGALTRFYEDLVSGAPMPLRMVTRKVTTADTLLALALFSSRDLVQHPATHGVVAAVDLLHRYGPTFGSQVEPDVYRLCRLLEGYLQPGLGKAESGERIGSAIGWVREFVMQGAGPHLGPPLPESRIVDQGTNGFVVAESADPSVDAWVEVYRVGFLRGVIFGPPDGDYRKVVVSRKSREAPLDLHKAESILNELEKLGGEPPEWRVQGLFLFGPEGGTNLLVSNVVDVLVRC